MVSFSLGALAIVLNMSPGPFFDVIREGGSEKSLYIKFIAVFFHFVLVQMIGVFGAILCLFSATQLTSFLFFWVFCYSIGAGVAAGINLFGLAQLKNGAGKIGD
ncbi:hypothetical protein B6K69_05955 [Fuscovulum blasticum]|nr:hypothetical protein B6K69_05955 [Fuscovulum blasticum]